MSETPPEASIVVENVARAFGEVQAVRDASFFAGPGTVTALIGPNGSGKTTLLLMLASLLRPDFGQIRIAGFDPVTDTAAVRSRLGWMPDLLGSWNALTGRANLETTARLYRMDAASAAARANELIALVGLEQLAAQPTRVLSRGQKQRLSLARALVHDPAVLLDEPASGLDPQARVDLRRLVRRVASQGKTVLISSHELAELDEMADGAVYLQEGVTASAERVTRTRSTARPWRIRAVDHAALESALLAAGVDAGTIVVDRDELLVPLQGEAAASALLTALVGAGIGVIVSLELRQRVRGRAWYVLLGVFFALGGNAINGERDAGTLATTQVTLITTGQIVIGKFLAAWITALGFLAVSVPFLIYAALLGGLSGGLSGAGIVVSILVLAVELGVVSAIGVGLSGVLNRPLFSIVATYLAVAALSIGTLIAFALGGLVMQSEQIITTSTGVAFDQNGVATSCVPGHVQIVQVPRFDYFWGVLVTNPYVLLADAVPTTFDSRGNVSDLFGVVKAGVRAAQITPPTKISYGACGADASNRYAGGSPFPTAQKLIESTVPGWAVGLLIQPILATAALAGAGARTRTPAGRLSRGSRIA